ncbi:MAG: hypothetical protein RI945_63 [Candidatus Parcubacteria bacterium]
MKKMEKPEKKFSRQMTLLFGLVLIVYCIIYTILYLIKAL